MPRLNASPKIPFGAKSFDRDVFGRRKKNSIDFYYLVHEKYLKYKSGIK